MHNQQGKIIQAIGNQFPDSKNSINSICLILQVTLDVEENEEQV